MKHFGSICDFIEERNNELLKAYRVALSQAKYIISDEIFKTIVNMPTTRFWVSEERAMIVVTQMMKGNKKPCGSKPRIEMYNEIYKRVKKLMAAHPHMPLIRLVRMAIYQPAPKYYITPGTAKIVIWKAKRKWIEERKKKLRHLY